MAESTAFTSPTQAGGFFGGGGVGVSPSGVGIQPRESGGGNRQHFTRFDFSIQMSIANAGGAPASGGTSQLLYTFPVGRILVQNIIGSIVWTSLTPTSGASIPIASGVAGTWAVGTTGATNNAITNTNANYLAGTAFTTAAQNVAVPVSNAVAPAYLTQSIGPLGWQDGTVTAINMYLNLGIAAILNGTTGILQGVGYVQANWLFGGDL